MRTINITLKNSNEVTLDDLIGSTGVYIIWGPRAKIRPTYIGEGYIYNRLYQHIQTYSKNIDVVVGITGSKDKTSKEVKEDAQIAESILLYTADIMDIWPIENINLGRTKILEKIYHNEDIKLRLKGCHPFKRPGTKGWRLNQTENIFLNFVEVENGKLFPYPDIEHNLK